MNKKDVPEKINDYLNDLNTIKDILIKTEGKPLFENWAFYVWGIIVYIGTLLQYLLIKNLILTYEMVFIKLWVPVLLILMLVEIAALVKRLNREAIHIFPKSIIKLYLGLTGSSICLVLVAAAIIKTGQLIYLPSIILSFFAVFYFLYAQISHINLYVQGYFLLFAGLILYSTDFDILVQFTAAGIIFGTSLLSAGILSSVKEKKQNE